MKAHERKGSESRMKVELKHMETKEGRMKAEGMQMKTHESKLKVKQ